MCDLYACAHTLLILCMSQVSPDHCNPCASGFIPSKDHSSCNPCDWFQKNPTPGATQCLDCGMDEISTPGSHECTPLRNCTTSDYYNKPMTGTDGCVEQVRSST